jgi:hypothetical protein
MATAIAKARRSAPRRSPASSGPGQDVSNRDKILAAVEALLAPATPIDQAPSQLGARSWNGPEDQARCAGAARRVYRPG